MLNFAGSDIVSNSKDEESYIDFKKLIKLFNKMSTQLKIFAFLCAVVKVLHYSC